MRNMEYIMHGLSTGMRSGVIKKKTVWKMLRKTRKRFSRECILEKKHLCSTGSERHRGNGDYRTFAEIMDSAMKEWGILPEDTGYVEGRLISDTKEIVFDPDHARFSIHTPYCGYFSGAPEEEISLSDKICVEAENERITLALIAKDEIKMDGASEYILTAMGTTGMDETTFGKGPELMGIPFAAVEFKGKLYAETLEGCIRVKAENAKLEVLNPIGEVIAEMNGEKTGDEIRFAMDGSVPGIQYRLVVGE